MYVLISFWHNYQIYLCIYLSARQTCLTQLNRNWINRNCPLNQFTTPVFTLLLEENPVPDKCFLQFQKQEIVSECQIWLFLGVGAGVASAFPIERFQKLLSLSSSMRLMLDVMLCRRITLTFKHAIMFLLNSLI